MGKSPRKNAKHRTNPVMAEISATRGLAGKIAAACGLHRTSVVEWKQVPPRHVLTVAKLLKRSPHSIRPDLYPKA